MTDNSALEAARAKYNADIIAARLLVNLSESMHNGEIRQRLGEEWYTGKQALDWNREVTYDMAALLPRVLTAYAVLEAHVAAVDAELMQARAANTELVEALDVLWRWNTTDEFDHLEIEQLNYGFMTATQRVYDLVMRYGVGALRPMLAASPANADADAADGAGV